MQLHAPGPVRPTIPNAALAVVRAHSRLRKNAVKIPLLFFYHQRRHCLVHALAGLYLVEGALTSSQL
jgi:hypothetical protein